MTVRGLTRYLRDKAEAMRATAKKNPDAASYLENISAVCVADDLTGLRKIRIRDWEYLSDSGSEMGGWGLAPSSPEYLLGVISSCLTHTVLIGASMRDVPLERVEVRSSAKNNDAHFFGLTQDDPTYPWDIAIEIVVDAPEATTPSTDTSPRRSPPCSSQRRTQRSASPRRSPSSPFRS